MSPDSHGQRSLDEFSSSDLRGLSGQGVPRCDVCGSEMEYSENAEAWLCQNGGCEGTRSVEEFDGGHKTVGQEEEDPGSVFFEEDNSDTRNEIHLL